LFLGNALARNEGRVDFDEILSHCSDWRVDLVESAVSSSSSVRRRDGTPGRI
jgi:hypothetical protein